MLIKLITYSELIGGVHAGLVLTSDIPSSLLTRVNSAATLRIVFSDALCEFPILISCLILSLLEESAGYSCQKLWNN